MIMIWTSYLLGWMVLPNSLNCLNNFNNFQKIKNPKAMNFGILLCAVNRLFRLNQDFNLAFFFNQCFKAFFDDVINLNALGDQLVFAKVALFHEF